MTEALQPIGAEEIVMLTYSAMFFDGGPIEFVAHDENTECMFIGTCLCACTFQLDFCSRLNFYLTESPGTTEL